MQMRRGDLVTVAATGYHGKLRPAVIVQTDAFPENHASVVVCQLTSELVDAPDFRVTLEPKPENGLRLKSQVMADKPVTMRRERIGQKIGVSANRTWPGSELPWRLSWGSRISDASGPGEGEGVGCARSGRQEGPVATAKTGLSSRSTTSRSCRD
jgi:mRNA interferase MazF